MIRVDPKSFCGPRAYFTDFDHRIVSRSRNLDTIKLKGERKLKALLLLKGQIVCAASHLSTRFAYEFFKDNPILLVSEAIVPAFRSDKTDFSELFAKKRFKEKDSAIIFFKEHITKTVNWNLDENSMWFRDRFLKDVEDDHSLVSTHISPENRHIVKKLAAEIRKGSLLGRAFIDRGTKGLPRQEKRLLQNYRELLYHMSGARVVNCESALPQENYIDYDIADLQQKRARLSEEQILSKVLIELVFDSFQKSMLPVELLDLLTFEDILQIRQPLLESSFQRKYDSLVRSVVSPHEMETSEFLDIDKLEIIRKDLSESFNNVLQKELPNFLKKKALEHSKELASISLSVALGVAGAVPGVGLVASAISIMKDTPALLVNIGQTYRSVRAISNQDEYYQNKEQLIKTEIEKSTISEKAIMYEMVDMLLNIISKRIQI
ncbi:hypothetical protein [uncultured Desulfobacter sp.]|uniref:hypothetical protein n=1 Tax=uncultured Desulfobacter sp. TaxID=240139 RepID=UPI00259B887F|nr:hypothetical protein [uncultured Desulfobacter sp.]